MTYRGAQKMKTIFTIDGEYNIKMDARVVEDAMSKGYIYANLFFYDEVQKEINKLHQMVLKIYDDVVTELGKSADPPRLLLEMSTRANRALGTDGLDAMIKEFLAEKSPHMALVVDERERAKFQQICEAIFLELTQAFYTETLQTATDLENDVKTFKFAKEYIATLTAQQKAFIAPALRFIAFENQVKLNRLEVAQDFTVKYIPEQLQGSFTTQEETIKDAIKTFIAARA
jgi:hypothetical protein